MWRVSMVERVMTSSIGTTAPAQLDLRDNTAKRVFSLHLQSNVLIDSREHGNGFMIVFHNE